MNRCFAGRLLIVAPFVMTGCTSSADKSGPKEPIPAYQVALVRNGRSDEINVVAALLTSVDWTAIAGCPSLRALLLDNPAQEVSAADLQQLSTLKKLEHLRVRGRGIDDEAVRQ